MLLFGLILAVYGISVKGECQGNIEQRILTCSQIIRRPVQLSDIGNLDPEEKQRVCTNVREGMTCSLDIINECADSPQLASTGTPVETMRASLNSGLQDLSKVCSPGVSSTDADCPRGEQISRSITECFNIISSGPNEPLCSKVWRALDCIDQLVSQCQHLPDWQAVLNSGALDAASQQMQQTCGQRPTNDGQGNSNNVDTVDRTCTTNLMNEIATCSAGFKAFGEAAASERRSKCGEVRESVSCIESLAVRCPQSSVVQSALSSTQSLVGNLEAFCGPQ
ncbi:uncharacterized protein LOC121390045 isoform X1 [Gigantopelta aegis]|uniref:uncharacterized protein LOC121390045 isoform X1 n=1 Tax=Gigantopelta aegis TaxID=1735272 RepID=UPI001B88D9CB|nr:uncharacterized protein LOC121390045 isoform X1 [Gigantopelta aegis]